MIEYDGHSEAYEDMGSNQEFSGKNNYIPSLLLIIRHSLKEILFDLYKIAKLAVKN